MSTAVTQLARFGISMEDARAFIEANLNNPQAIFNAAQTAGLTNGMLGEIAYGASAADVKSFFQEQGINSNGLDLASPAGAQLAQFGVSLEDGMSFVQANINNPTLLFNISQEYGLSYAVLGELAGNLTAEGVENYFRAYGLIEDDTPVTPPDDTGGGVDLIPAQWAKVATVVSLNTNTGALSNASIRDKVISQTSEADYLRAFDPMQYEAQDTPSDGVLTAEELGLSHLANLPATVETVESLLYGTIIKTQQSLDMSEALTMSSFLQTNSAALENGDPTALNGYLDMMANIWSTPATTPLIPEASILDVAVLTGVAFVETVKSGGAPSLFNLDTLI